MTVDLILTPASGPGQTFQLPSPYVVSAGIPNIGNGLPLGGPAGLAAGTGAVSVVGGAGVNGATGPQGRDVERAR